MSIPDYYQVKWADHGVTMYGICDRFSEEAKEHYAATGRVLISDAILPIAHSVAIADLTPIKAAFNNNECDAFVAAEFRKAQELSDSLPDGVAKGKLFCTPRGDGYAWYVITKVNKKTIHIEWRGYSADRWTDMMLSLGGKFPRDMIEPYVLQLDARRSIFKTRANKELSNA